MHHLVIISSQQFFRRVKSHVTWVMLQSALLALRIMNSLWSKQFKNFHPTMNPTNQMTQIKFSKNSSLFLTFCLKNLSVSTTTVRVLDRTVDVLCTGHWTEPFRLKIRWKMFLQKKNRFFQFEMRDL